MNTVELFVPFKFDKKPIYESIISRMFNHKAMFVSKGRYAITHILKSYGINDGVIAISAYMCPSVRDILLQKGYEVVYYDIDPVDLNAEVNSVAKVIEKKAPKSVVIASMYGNPADLTVLEKLCREKNVIMIDDAAQSFGAKLDERFVGSFGDGGFFSFSPGKPTAAHRGGYCWTSKLYEFKRTRHFFNALVTYKDYKYRRYLAYENHKLRRVVWSGLALITSKLPINIENDRMEYFEKFVLGGVFDANIDEAISYRSRWIHKFSEIDFGSGCRLLKGIRGISNNCKVVLVFEDEARRNEFSNFLKRKSIAFYGGYRVPQDESMKTARRIEGKIIELPIESREDKMNYLYAHVKEFFDEAGG